MSILYIYLYSGHTEESKELLFVPVNVKTIQHKLKLHKLIIWQNKKAETWDEEMKHDVDTCRWTHADISLIWSPDLLLAQQEDPSGLPGGVCWFRGLVQRYGGLQQPVQLLFRRSLLCLSSNGLVLLLQLWTKICRRSAEDARGHRRHRGHRGLCSVLNPWLFQDTCLDMGNERQETIFNSNDTKTPTKKSEE